MSMNALYDLKEMLCKELEEIAGKGEMSAGDLETTHKLTDTIKNIDKILMLEEDGGYAPATGKLICAAPMAVRAAIAGADATVWVGTAATEERAGI